MKVARRIYWGVVILATLLGGPFFGIVFAVLLIFPLSLAFLIHWIIKYGNENWGAGPTPDSFVTVRELHRK